MTKILYVCGDTERIGGIEKYNKDFITALKLHSSNDSGFSSIKVVQRWPGGIAAKLSFLLRFILQFFLYRPQVIFCGHLHFSSVCYFLNKVFKTPYVLSLYGIEIIALESKMQRQAVENAQIIVTISEYSKQLILEKFPNINPKIFMHPSSVNGEVYRIKEKNQSFIEKYNLKNRPVILSLARLSTSEFKGQDRVLKALPKVLESYPNAIYLIVGGGEDLRVNQILEQQPELRKNIVFTGPVSEEDKVEFYNLADVYVLPSKFEGFGIVFIEALACGTKVIASDAYGCRASLLDGELGSLVDPDDVNSIANSIVLNLKDENFKNLLFRKQLREKTLKIYGYDAWIGRTAQLKHALKLDDKR